MKECSRNHLFLFYAAVSGEALVKD